LVFHLPILEMPPDERDWGRVSLATRVEKTRSNRRSSKEKGVDKTYLLLVLSQWLQKMPHCELVSAQVILVVEKDIVVQLHCAKATGLLSACK